MAKDRKKVQHIHSSVFDKQPTPESIELGELAVNVNKDGSFISTKNNENKVVRFSEDATIVDWMEYKEVFPYSGSVLTNLSENKSQILFKINQVAAKKTPYYSSINGATDMNGNEINPISPDGTNGAGFAVDMDVYVMNGGNPSFSSVTTTCGAILNGTTKIQGTNDSCGSLLDINVGTANTVVDSASTKIATNNYSGNTLNITANTSTLSGDTIDFKSNDFNLDIVNDMCLKSRSSITLYANNSTNVGVSCDGTAKTAVTNIRGNKVVVDASLDNLGLTAKEDIIESAENDIIITANNTLCQTAGTNATIYGVNNTNIGVDCNGNATSNNTNINGRAINISGDTSINGSVTISNGLAAKVCSEYGDVRSSNGSCCNLSGNTTTNFTIPNEFRHMKNHKNSDGSHTTDYYTFEYPVEVNGTVTANGAIYSSDRRLKENIKVVSRNDYNKAKRVQTKSFNFKDDVHKTKTYGVIAQEVEDAGLNELVYVKEDGFKAVDYTSFIMLKLSYLEDYIVNIALKVEELNKKINELENK